MKDSRLGNYGAVTLLLAILIKFFALRDQQRALPDALVALLSLHVLSRAVAAASSLTCPMCVRVAKPNPWRKTSLGLIC
jgi:cobalamin synthase